MLCGNSLACRPPPMCAAPSSALPQAPLQTLAGETSAAGLGPQLSSSIAPLPYFGFRFVACFRALAPSALSAREHQRFLVASAMAREIKRRIISDRVGMSCSRRRSSSRSALICAERRICRILSCSMSGIGAAAARLVNIVVAPVTIDVVCIVITVLTYCQASCLLIPHETSGGTRREHKGAPAAWRKKRTLSRGRRKHGISHSRFLQWHRRVQPRT